MSWKLFRIIGIPFHHKVCYDYKRISELFIWFSPIINPILYSLIGRNFRQKLAKTILKMCGGEEREIERKPFSRTLSLSQTSTYGNKSFFGSVRGNTTDTTGYSFGSPANRTSNKLRRSTSNT